jgi:hypothetical protein
MKKQILLLLLTVSFMTVQSQTAKTIIITKTPKTVPAGKKWKLETDSTTKIQVSYGVLNSGTMCNALFLSNPKMIFNINKGDLLKAESFGIIFKDPEKVQYTNDYTYEITPISIVDKDFSVSELQYSKPENVGEKKIEFKAGEKVFVSNCLESIELIEVSMSQTEIAAEKKKQEAKTKQNTENSANFNIPVNPEKYVEPGTKPALQDSSLKSIVFSSPSVLWKKPGKKYSLDDVTKWTLTLTDKVFEMTSSSSYEKSYTILAIKYNETFRGQEFQLDDGSGVNTHTLIISYSKQSKQYSVILNSIDYTEEYQFQEVQATDKQYQAK